MLCFIEFISFEQTKHCEFWGECAIFLKKMYMLLFSDIDANICIQWS